MGTNLYKQDYKISRKEREQQIGHKSKVLWFIGLSGSGKSTLCDAVESFLFQKGFQTYILDGDNIRMGINKDLDFSSASRSENIRRISEIAKLFTDSGKIILTAFINMIYPYYLLRYCINNSERQESLRSI